VSAAYRRERGAAKTCLGYGFIAWTEIRAAIYRSRKLITITGDVFAAPRSRRYACAHADRPAREEQCLLHLLAAELDLNKCMGNLKGRKVITPVDIQSALPAKWHCVKWSEKGLSFIGSLTGPGGDAGGTDQNKEVEFAYPSLSCASHSKLQTKNSPHIRHTPTVSDRMHLHDLSRQAHPIPEPAFFVVKNGTKT